MKKSTASQEHTRDSAPDTSEHLDVGIGVESTDDHGEGLPGEFDPSDLDAALGNEEYDEEGDYGDYTDDDAHDHYDDSAHHPSHSVAHSPSFLATAGLVVGLLKVVAGLGLAAVWNMEVAKSVRDVLTAAGIGPMDITVCGLVLAGIAALRRSQRRQEAELAAAVDAAHSGASLQEELHTKLQEIAKSSTGKVTADTPGGLHQVLHLMKRQEDKINNLSKATKMYGKPLLEITNQISESGHQIGEMISTVNAVKIIVEQSTARLESTVRTEMRRPEEAEHETKEAVRATREAVTRLETLQRELAQALSNSTDKIAGEVRETTRSNEKAWDELKGEVRETTQSNHKVLEELKGEVRETTQSNHKVLEELKGEVTKAAAETVAVNRTASKLSEEMAELDRRVDEARAALLDGMKSMGENQAAAAGAPAPSLDTSGLEDTLAKIRKELSGLTGEIANLKAAAPAGGGGAPAADQGQGQDKPSGTKSVQSAIAKLKQMRS